MKTRIVDDITPNDGNVLASNQAFLEVFGCCGDSRSIFIQDNVRDHPKQPP